MPNAGIISFLNLCMLISLFVTLQVKIIGCRLIVGAEKLSTKHIRAVGKVSELGVLCKPYAKDGLGYHIA